MRFCSSRTLPGQAYSFKLRNGAATLLPFRQEQRLPTPLFFLYSLWPGKGAVAALSVLDYLHYAKAAAGDMAIGTVSRVTVGYFGYIDPKRDWYETPRR